LPLEKVQLEVSLFWLPQLIWKFSHVMGFSQ